MNAPARPPLPQGLYALCDDGVAPHRPLVEKARLLLEGGVRVMQLRMKHAPAREGLSTAKAVVALCRARGALCIINDRVDWALVCGADGAHVGEEDLPASEARAALGPGLLLGVTARSSANARQAAADGADYVGVGPIFATATKSVPAALLGVEGLRRVVADSPLAVVAIAGIGLDNIAQVAAAGAHGAAVLSDLLQASDIPARARALAAAFQTAAGRHTLLPR